MASKKRQRKQGSSKGAKSAPKTAKKATRAEKVAQQKAAAPELSEPSEGEQAPSAGSLQAVPPVQGRWNRLAWAALAAVALSFLALKSYSFHWQVGDENVYMYMAWATLDHGALPYRDYFFAHPPLHLLPGIPFFGLFGIGPVTARILPVGASLISALFLFLMVRDRIGRFAAVGAAFALLMSFSLLRASTHWTGINLALMWLSIGLYFLFRGRPATAGAMMALGVCTGNYVLPGAVMAGLLAVLECRRSGLRYLLGFIAPWGAIQLLGLLVGGGTYLDGVYSYHFKKTVKEGVFRNMFWRVVTDNFLLFLGLILAPLLAWWDRWLGKASGLDLPPKPVAQTDKGPWWSAPWFWWRALLLEDGPRGLARIGAMWTLGYLLFMATLPRVFPFYFLLMFPALALTVGFVGDRLLAHGLAFWRSRAGRNKRWLWGVGLLAGVLVFVGLAYLVRVPLQRQLLPRYVRSRPVPMQWSDSPLPVNGLLRWCCWDDVAGARASYGTVQEVLYHESRYFEQGQTLADFVLQNSRPQQTIFGDSSSAGLVALLSERRLAMDFADTNTQRFASGTCDPGDVIADLKKEDLAFVLVTARRKRAKNGQLRWKMGKFATVEPFSSWLDQSFEVAHKVRDRTKGIYLLLSPRP